MKIEIEYGWLAGVRRVPSPYCDDRPAGAAIDVIVVHGISLPPGEFGGPGIEQLFTGTLDASLHPFYAEVADLRVSAHVLVRRDGELVQFVPFTRRAWHAGRSRFGTRVRCNDFSIGIELEGADLVPYTDAQYLALRELVACCRQQWPAIKPTHVVGHSDIAPGRKTDPGPAFDWSRLRSTTGTVG